MEDIRHLVETHAPSHGLFPTGLDGVSLYRTARPSPRQPAVMPPLLYIVVQGTKYAYLDDTTYRYGPVPGIPVVLLWSWPKCRSDDLLAGGCVRRASGRTTLGKPSNRRWLTGAQTRDSDPRP